jgi:hypothetical protein
VKQCSKCADAKPETDFYVKRRRASGEVSRYSWCKSCHTSLCVTQRQSKRDEINAYERQRRKAPAHRERRKQYRKRPQVRAKERSATREYRERNKERDLPKVRIRRRRNESARRERGYNPSRKPSPAVKQALELARIGNKYLDAYSGELIDRPTIDHVTPLALGGTGELENLCITSRSNNASKCDDLLIVWMAKKANRETPPPHPTSPTKA